MEDIAKIAARVWRNLKDPSSNTDASNAKALMNEYLKNGTLSGLGVSKKETEEEMISEFQEDLSKRYLKQGLEVWKRLRDPNGKTDAHNAKYLIEHYLKEGGFTLAALDISEKKTEQEMKTELDKAVSARNNKKEKRTVPIGKELYTKEKDTRGYSTETPGGGRKFVERVKGGNNLRIEF